MRDNDSTSLSSFVMTAGQVRSICMTPAGESAPLAPKEGTPVRHELIAEPIKYQGNLLLRTLQEFVFAQLTAVSLSADCLDLRSPLPSALPVPPSPSATLTAQPRVRAELSQVSGDQPVIAFEVGRTPELASSSTETWRTTSSHALAGKWSNTSGILFQRTRISRQYGVSDDHTILDIRHPDSPV